MSLVKTGRAQWNSTAPAEPVEERRRLQKSYRPCRNRGTE